MISAVKDLASGRFSNLTLILTIFEKFAAWSNQAFSKSLELRLSTNKTSIYNLDSFCLKTTDNNTKVFYTRKEMQKRTDLRCTICFQYDTVSVLLLD